ncbi:formate dehydrogenase accessory sulfurtransferase FdhD [Rhodoferax aquaticus]|uniref:Sulfur carrier protein FdhD n=1 Tax=Rhodoferax aquaticus TaxID=2527691 RepID=A0A515EMA3_9BURK|nr:formate dehydrogenase accessory sulfurtransferase FdhD [Rhodoferax aquaticus]QDL53793.1 formate dehydrogenase accessory sulfurtransferase FdhD [Rhodoferax aquaticus]
MSHSSSTGEPWAHTLPAAVSARSVVRVPQGLVQTDTLAAELPVALVFNGISHAVMMATPQDLEAFALGFALSEGILDSPSQCFGMEVLRSESCGQPAVEVHLEIAAACFVRLKAQRRSMAGRTGCGVCGLDSLQALDLSPPAMPDQPWARRVQPQEIFDAIRAMLPLQQLNALCGSLHAAAWVGADGQLALVMEDVGRHNALDKVLGALAQQGRPYESGWMLMSSRASHELVRKCVRLRVPMLATISAPTDLAVAMAQRAGLHLWGLCRAPRAVLYTPAQDPTAP